MYSANTQLNIFSCLYLISSISPSQCILYPSVPCSLPWRAELYGLSWRAFLFTGFLLGLDIWEQQQENKQKGKSLEYLFSGFLTWRVAEYWLHPSERFHCFPEPFPQSYRAPVFFLTLPIIGLIKIPSDFTLGLKDSTKFFCFPYLYTLWIVPLLYFS